MSLWKNIDDSNSAPSSVTDAATGENGIREYGSEIFYVAKEQALPVTPGWVRKIIRGNRINYECIVPMRTVFDEDFALSTDNGEPLVDDDNQLMEEYEDAIAAKNKTATNRT